MKLYFLIAFVAAVAVVVYGRQTVYFQCMSYISLQKWNISQGTCNTMSKRNKEACDKAYEDYSKPFRDLAHETTVTIGYINCKFWRCELTKEFCEANKARFERLPFR
ncbi:unnamed protein product [Bursaphelenchus xylophilus]|uniref:(pine wood nematode) hypothetical protein n=1 Tax=Bursaphelenchus xylophilus TaxID=6326 RepID=A0A1I7S834_BURXY|nr:unnamed protein product [Bursaphelenchus xylophilus]CAG9080634.1 unnamed protein product [Bursaphelenchus xylophilus]